MSRQGEVLNYWAMLDPTAGAKRLVAEMGGTRHTSAKRYSYNEPGSIVVVVSEDGPVTIFSDGAMIARFVDASRAEQPSWATRMPLDEAAQVESVTENVRARSAPSRCVCMSTPTAR